MRESIQIFSNDIKFYLLLQLEIVLKFLGEASYSVHSYIRKMSGQVIAARIRLYFQTESATQEITYNGVSGSWVIDLPMGIHIKKQYITKEKSNVSKRKRNRSKAGDSNKSKRTATNTNATGKGTRTSKKPKRSK